MWITRWLHQTMQPLVPSSRRKWGLAKKLSVARNSDCRASIAYKRIEPESLCLDHPSLPASTKAMALPAFAGSAFRFDVPILYSRSVVWREINAVPSRADAVWSQTCKIRGEGIVAAAQPDRQSKTGCASFAKFRHEHFRNRLGVWHKQTNDHASTR